MTEFRLKWSDKCIKEYVKKQLFGSKGVLAAIIVMYSLCFLIMPVIGIINYFVMNEFVLLEIGIITFVMGILLIGIFIASVEIISRRTSRALKANTDLNCAVSDSNILIIKNNTPHTVIDWSSVQEIMEGKSAYYVSTKENVLLILEKDAVESGVISEADEILRIKSEAIKKNAQ